MGIPIGGLMGIGGDSLPPHIYFKNQLDPHGDVDLQIFYSIDKSIFI